MLAHLAILPEGCTGNEKICWRRTSERAVRSSLAENAPAVTWRARLTVAGANEENQLARLRFTMQLELVQILSQHISDFD